MRIDREIKFRAFYAGLMYEVEALKPIEERVFLSEDGLTGWDTYAKLTDPDLHIMQFTGLKDRNGKEIWEGDIVEWYSGLVPKGTNPVVRQVVTRNRREVRFENTSGAVIGNIYENPELLEQSE